MGKTLLIAGLVIAGIGSVSYDRPQDSWLGRLPGDIAIKRENFSFYFPLGTCILISVVLSLIFWLFRR